MKKFVKFLIFNIALLGLAGTTCAASLVVTAPKTDDLKPVKIYNYNTKKETKKIWPYGKNFSGGINLAVGDVTGDGKDEIIVGPKSNWQPEIRIYSKNGKKISSFFAYNKNVKTSIDVATGDLNNDGKDEIITASGKNTKPVIRFFNKKGEKIAPDILAFPANFNKGINITTGDIDSDGQDEIIVATNEGQAPYIEIYNSKQEKIGQFLIFDQNFRGGVNISAGDMNNDGYDEIAACQASSGTQCKIFRFGFKKNSIKELKATKYPSSIVPNFGDIDSDGNKELLVSDSQKPILTSYNLLSDSKSALKLNNHISHSEIAYITDNSFNFIVYGDTQQLTDESHSKIVEGVLDQEYDMAFHVGDFTQNNTINEWEIFQRIERNIISKAPVKGLSTSLFPIIGNHEYPFDNFFNFFNFQPINQLYYSFDYKNAHFTILNSEIDFSPGSSQYEWLVSDLQTTTQDWKIVFFHRPPYNSNYRNHMSHPNDDIKTNIVPVLEQNGVNIVFNGHAHIYERTFPIYQDKADFEKGITYIITCAAYGNPINQNWWTAKSKSESTFVKIKLQENTAKGYVFDPNQNFIERFNLNLSNK